MFKKAALIIIALTFALMAGVFLFAEDIEIRVSEVEAQSAINDYLNSNETDKRRVRISPEYFTLDFKANNTAEISSHALVDGFGYAGQFKGKFAAGVDYRVPHIYLDQLSLIDGGFSTDDQTQSELSNLKNAATDALKRQRNAARADGKELFPENPETDDADIVESYIIVATRTLFESIPIYDVARSGKTGRAASLALKDVRFTEHDVVIILNPVTALLRILAALGIFCLAIAWFIGPSLVSMLFSRLMDAPQGEND